VQLKTAFNEVCAEHEPIVVERRKGGDVILRSHRDYNSLNETAYLLRAPANARRLLQAVKALKRAVAKLLDLKT
jgi:antitoxin YefM